MSTRRVVVTGLGALTPLANDFPQTWSRLIRGESGIAPVTAFDTTGYDCRIAGEVRNFDPAPAFKNPKDVRRTDRYTHLAMAAAGEAWKDAGLDAATLDLDRAGARRELEAAPGHAACGHQPVALDPGLAADHRGALHRLRLQLLAAQALDRLVELLDARYGVDLRHLARELRVVHRVHRILVLELRHQQLQEPVVHLAGRQRLLGRLARGGGGGGLRAGGGGGGDRAHGFTVPSAAS